MARGLPYWTFLSEELLALARSFFPLSDAREENFVAGLSMGGYGAFKLALQLPGQVRRSREPFGRAGCRRTRGPRKGARPARAQGIENIFGDPSGIAGSANDLFFLAQEVARSEGPKPVLFQCCGTEDALRADNLRFLEHARRCGSTSHTRKGRGSMNGDSGTSGFSGCWNGSRRAGSGREKLFSKGIPQGTTITEN